MVELFRLWTFIMVAHLFVHTAEITTTNVVTLNENKRTDVKVADVQCTDGTNMVLTGTISPTSFCTFCFVVEPTDVGTGAYKVNFYPSVADLTFSQVPEYDITLTCTDLANSSNVATEVLEIRITPNSAPIFADGLTHQEAISGTKDKVAGDTLFRVSASDPNSDEIFYTLTRTDPASDNFQIGLTDGMVSAVNDLNTQCTQEIDLYITITDGNIEVGPQVIDVTLQDSNEVPVIDTTDDRISLAEDTVLDTSIVTIAFTDDTAGAALTFTTVPVAAEDLFTLDVDELKLASALDYEDTSLRRPLVLFTVEDGGCTSSTFTYTVSVTNVNEAPVIGPEDNVLDVYEGDIQLDPEWTTTDPDFGDDLTYSITASTPTAANFDIDPRSGIISSIVEYDVDQGAMTATVTLTIEVGGH
ncbi:hypothetical protein RRG08_012713 [Elysia crispata]|uniref:Cadherin domain-containing protein n=1 Tax=Elysia crispata TaxID=231223 RepID=A0AAE1DN17_9GAST|nr:hypothetical protein RRG08_012713 [Elysia crispata]